MNDKIRKQDDAVMKCLDVTVIRRPICTTNKGILDLVIRKGENNYFLSIDSVPLEKEINDKLMEILFTTPVPQVNKTPITISAETAPVIIKEAIEKIKKAKLAKVK